MKKDVANYKFKCYYSNCEKAYLTKYHLRRHINAAHLQIKSFVCSQCSKAFSSKQNYKEHEISHSQSKNSPTRVEIFKNTQEPNNSNEKSLLSMLTRIFREEPQKASKINTRNKPMPVLPPVDFDRQSIWGTIKIPIIPILLN